MSRRGAMGLFAASLLAAPAISQETANGSVVEASCRFTPESAEIGEPLTLELDLVHPDSVRPRLDGALPALDGSWILYKERRVVTRPLADRPGHSLTRAWWSLGALEPGEHELLPGGAEYEWQGTPRRVEGPPARVTVRHALADGEDAPRDPIGFREPPPERDSPLGPLAWTFGLLVAGALALLAWRLIRRRRAPAPAGPPGPAERLTVLRSDDPEKLRELYYVVSAAVREALDTVAGEDLAACTDEEWIERRKRGNGLAPERLERAAELLRACERVKYGAEIPTRWAVDDALRSAREIVEGKDGNGEHRENGGGGGAPGDRGGES